MKTKKSVPQLIWGFVKGNPIVIMMVVISLFVGFTIENFFSLETLNVLLGNTTIRFLIALGVSGCLITKGTDLSAGRQAALAATLTGVMIQRIDYSGRLFTKIPTRVSLVAVPTCQKSRRLSIASTAASSRLSRSSSVRTRWLQPTHSQSLSPILSRLPSFPTSLKREWLWRLRLAVTRVGE